MRHHAQLPLLASALYLFLGCSAPNPFPADDIERFQSSPPHPLSVHVSIDQDVVDEEAPKIVPLPSLIDPSNQVAIEEALVVALEKYNAFASAYRGAEGAEDADVELRVVLRQDPGVGNGETDRNNYAWANLGLWLFAGVPGWILADVSFNPEVRVSYVFNRRPARGPEEPNVLIRRGRVDFSDDTELNFLRRSGALGYAMQFLVPPFLVPPDDRKADRSLYENFVSRLQREVGTTAKQDLVDAQLRMSRNVPYLHEIEVDDERLFVLMSNDYIESGELRLGGTGESGPAVQVVWKDPYAEPDVIARLRQDDTLAALLDGKAHAYVQYFTAGGGGGAPDGSLHRLIVRLEGVEEPWTWTLRGTRPTIDGQVASR